jgi:hypothetical protein
MTMMYEETVEQILTVAVRTVMTLAAVAVRAVTTLAAVVVRTVMALAAVVATLIVPAVRTMRLARAASGDRASEQLQTDACGHPQLQR